MALGRNLKRNTPKREIGQGMAEKSRQPAGAYRQVGKGHRLPEGWTILQALAARGWASASTRYTEAERAGRKPHARPTVTLDALRDLASCRAPPPAVLRRLAGAAFACAA